jgi:hypothetical protein
MEGGIIRGKNLCIIGPNASECEWKYIRDVISWAYEHECE